MLDHKAHKNTTNPNSPDTQSNAWDPPRIKTPMLGKCLSQYHPYYAIGGIK